MKKQVWLVLFVAAVSSMPVFGQSDPKFVKEASEGGLAEIELGQLAQQKGHNQAVKEFGARMVRDHSKANTELQSVAAQKGLSVSTSVSVKDKASKVKLEALSGDDFDKAYMSAMVKDHENDIAAFQKEAESGTDPAVQSFAEKTLPALKEHLSMAEKVAGEVGAK